MTRIDIAVSLALSTLAATALAERTDTTPKPSPTAPIINIPPGAKLRKLTVNAPKSNYPYEARKHHWVGVGWFLMRVDEPSGAVTSVEILQSTGHKILDRAAVDSLKRWKFIPHSGFKKVKTPITFSMPPNEKA